jgi:dolichyl-phosphate beta-glucosyltransferase
VLSVVVPAYNESGRLPGSLRRMREHLDAAGEEYEVIVVDDGSADDTYAGSAALAESWPQLTVLRFERNRGKGAAVREGMLHAKGEHRLFSDADLSTPLEELPRLRSQLEGDTHVAIGSRGLADSRIEVHQEKRRELMGRTYNKLLQLLVLPGVHDSQCGFKVFTAEAAVACFGPLRTMRFGFDAEVLLRAKARGWRIAEVPVRWRHVEASRVNLVRDASRMLWDLVLLRVRRGR